MHELVRTDLWGYASNEELDTEDKFKVRYQGIRPAVGYPSIPDQSVNFRIDRLLNMSKIDVKLTENGAMFPNATVSGLFFAHPQSLYFAVGKIDERQLNEYAQNKGQTPEETKKWLSGNL
jgi:5-methyltetrahydrofolate--homocysteine methyltransferase